MTEAVADIFNATHVELLVGPEFDGAGQMFSSKLHSSLISVTMVRVDSMASVSAVLDRIVDGFSTNTKFHVVCLLSEQDYLTYIVPLGYVLLGPRNAKRNNCSGELVIARWPKSLRANSLMLAPPAKEERSNVLTLQNCTFPPDDEVLLMMQRYLNVTRLDPVASPLPFAPDDKFPQAGTLTGLLTHGEADVMLHQVTMNELRAFSTQFSFPMKYYNFAYMYPSPAVLTSTFTALKIFSLPRWWVSRPATLSGPLARQSQKTSVRILLAMLQFLLFVMSYCFTGCYTSFRNMPILEDAPDTKEKLLTTLRTGRLQPCVWGNAFGNATIARSNSTYISQLRAAVPDWSPFIADSLDICAERARRRQAVHFASLHVLHWYAHAFRRQVEVSKETLQNFRPICYVLPRASPYENAVQNAVMRIFEGGLFNEFERRYRYHRLGEPTHVSAEHSRLVFKMKDLNLPFIILAAGLGASSAAFICETLWRFHERRQRC
ncbi:hypothetical protein HPB50_017828 [Hyalomma asiaticum]|uniref:Uncharacterized protein n=1 Tax=Hyalomma asiaticum TaxID=266040 RepID=A0ACB7SXL0_HYAAI|nr:hypothetical protein HPB50_017828 [Hyalomma asiaticum]